MLFVDSLLLTLRIACHLGDETPLDLSQHVVHIALSRRPSRDRCRMIEAMEEGRGRLAAPVEEKRK